MERLRRLVRSYCNGNEQYEDINEDFDINNCRIHLNIDCEDFSLDENEFD